MLNLQLIRIFFLVLTSCTFVWSLSNENEVESLLRFLMKPSQDRVSEIENNGKDSSFYSKKNFTFMLTKYSWNSCGATSYPIQIQNIQLSPDPVELPGNIIVSASGSLSEDLSAPIAVSLKIQKKLGFIWIDLPCTDNIGSCNYDDICAMAAKFPCPPSFKKIGLQCTCPLKAGSYNVPPTSFYVDPQGIPKFLESGDYKVNAKASFKGQQVLCLDIDLSLK